MPINFFYCSTQCVQCSSRENTRQLGDINKKNINNASQQRA